LLLDVAPGQEFAQTRWLSPTGMLVAPRPKRGPRGQAALNALG